MVLDDDPEVGEDMAERTPPAKAARSKKIRSDENWRTTWAVRAREREEEGG